MFQELCVSGTMCDRNRVCQELFVSGTACVRNRMCQELCVSGTVCVRNCVCQESCVSGTVKADTWKDAGSVKVDPLAETSMTAEAGML